MYMRLWNGRHKNKLFTEVPTSYLRWMIEACHNQAEQAEIELKRRFDLSKQGLWTEIPDDPKPPRRRR